MNFKITSYTAEQESIWNEAAGQMRQQSFLLNRRYMDYHKDRFKDASLLVSDKHGHVVALLPANEARNCKDRIESHGGLTYGGLLTSSRLGAKDVGEILTGCLQHYAQLGYRHLLYKPMPHIYHVQPAEEDLYWMIRLGARLVNRAISSAVCLPHSLPLSKLRQRKVKKAEAQEGWLHLTDQSRLAAYWQVLDEVLVDRHDVHPVHTLQEMKLLMERFPQNIHLHTMVRQASSGNALKEEVLAGCVLFLMPRVAHVQYIAASPAGRETAALDLLFAQIISTLKVERPEVEYLDFGISTENHGQWLNEGLIFQKEGFGARGICYDEYHIDLPPCPTPSHPLP